MAVQKFRTSAWRSAIALLVNFLVLTVTLVGIAFVATPSTRALMDLSGKEPAAWGIDPVLALTACFLWRRLTTRLTVTAWARRHGWRVEDPRRSWPWRARLPGKVSHQVRLAVSGTVRGWPVTVAHVAWTDSESDGGPDPTGSGGCGLAVVVWLATAWRQADAERIVGRARARGKVPSWSVEGSELLIMTDCFWLARPWKITRAARRAVSIAELLGVPAAISPARPGMS